MSNGEETRVALITGASAGIGKAIASFLAAQGIAVGLLARRSQELQQVQHEIEQGGGRAVVVPVNLLDEQKLEIAIDAIETQLGPIDILVNNAGLVRRSALHEITPKQWDLQMALNLRVPFLLTRRVLPGMRSRNQGWIINISSEAAVELVAGMGAYAISKFALNRLTELTALENQAFNIHVLSICPGWVQTDMALSPETIGISAASVLRPEDIASTITWFIMQPAHLRISPILLVQPMNPQASLSASIKAMEQQNSAAAPSPR